MSQMKIRVVVCSSNASGVGDFFGTTVEVTQEQYDLGEHYDFAEDDAREAGFYGKMVSIDENEGPKWLFENVFKD